MDFREAESRFLQLQENYQNEAISEESFFQSVSKLMVQDPKGVYWTIDPKTGSWLFYNGHVWQRSVPPTKEITDKIKRVSKPRRTGGWAFSLLAGGFSIFGVLVVIALIAYRVFVVAHPPEVEIPSITLEAASPRNGALPALVILQGSADVRLGQDEPWRPAENDSYLQVGGSVRTHDGGRVQLVFSKDTVAEMGGNTEILLHEAAPSRSDLAHFALFLSYGDTWHQLDPQGASSRYEIETASAHIVTEGSLIHVLSRPQQETLVEVARGDAVITGAGESLRLTAGQKARVEPNEAPVLFPTPPLPTIQFKLTPTGVSRD